MPSGTKMTESSQQIAQFVRQFVQEHGRGCPKGVLLYGQGAKFSNKDVQRAMPKSDDNENGEGAIEGAKGRDGGFWPFGEVPESSGPDASLVSELADAIRTHCADKPGMRDLLSRYDAQRQARALNVAKARAARATG